MKGDRYNYKLLGQIRDAKYSQTTFAEMLGVTVVTLSRMENGHNASYELIFRACDLLDVDSSKIFYSNRRYSPDRSTSNAKSPVDILNI